MIEFLESVAMLFNVKSENYKNLKNLCYFERNENSETIENEDCPDFSLDRNDKNIHFWIGLKNSSSETFCKSIRF